MITKKKILQVVLLLAPVLLFSCNNDKDGEDGELIVENVYQSEVVAPKTGSTYKLGDKIPVNIKVKENGKQVQEMLVSVNGKIWLSTKEKKGEYSLEIPTDSIGLGQHTIIIDIKVEGNEYGEHPSASVTVLADTPPALYGFKVNAKFPHDPKAFTQGLLIDKGLMYEGTGQNGQSELRLWDFRQNKILKSVPLAREFGEGIALVGDKIYQLTYREGKCLVYDKNTFALLNTFAYPREISPYEGWGLTYDGKHLILSNGSPRLYFINPENFSVVKQIQVANDLGLIPMLNELEMINGEIWANVWMTNEIVQIDPASGKVKSRIDLTNLFPEAERPEGTDVLNGIAYDPATGKIYVTGKYWPWLYEIERVEKGS